MLLVGEPQLEEIIMDDESDFQFLQEVSAVPKVAANLKAMLGEAGKASFFGPLDPNVKKHNLGGVGAVAKKTQHRLIHLKPLSDEFKEAELNGRVMHFGMGTTSGRVISVFVIYGFSGGAGNKGQAHKTDLSKPSKRNGPCLPWGPAPSWGTSTVTPNTLKP